MIDKLSNKINYNVIEKSLKLKLDFLKILKIRFFIGFFFLGKLDGLYLWMVFFVCYAKFGLITPD